MISASIRDLGPGIARPLDVVILDANGNQITNFGGGSGFDPRGSNAAATVITSGFTASQVVLPANLNRKHFYFNNDTQKSVFITFGLVASATNKTLLIPARSQEKIEGYTGVVSAIGDNNPNGTWTITEVLP